MAASFRQWESDPLFSAAEVVQDSADRMDSIFHIFLHEQSIIQGDPTDQKLLSSINYHRRDLATALGTTKWQLEDFERAVNQLVFSNKSNTREDVISRHRQFIRAIEEQIFQVERSLMNSKTGISESSTQWMSLNEKDTDGLASFLSGGNPEKQVAQHDTDSGMMMRFFNSTNTSDFDKRSDEIVELKTEETEEPHTNGARHMDHNFDNLKKNTLRKVGSNLYTRPGFETSITIDDGSNEAGSLELEDSNAKNIFSKNKLRGSRSRLDVFGLSSNFWSVYGGFMSRTFSRRRNDKAAKKDYDQNLSKSSAGFFEAEKATFQNIIRWCSWDDDARFGLQWKWYRTNLFFLIAAAAVLVLCILGVVHFLQFWDLYILS